MWTSARSTARPFAEPSAVKTPPAPTAARPPATPATSPCLGADARVGVLQAWGEPWRRGDRGRSNGLTVCRLQMWMSAGTGPSAGPMLFARTCPAPSSASATRATRGHGTGVTAWVRGSRGLGGTGGWGRGRSGLAPLHRLELCELWGYGI